MLPDFPMKIGMLPSYGSVSLCRHRGNELLFAPPRTGRENAGGNGAVRDAVGDAVGYYDTRMSALPRQRASRPLMILVAAVALLALALPSAAQTSYFSDWPAGTSPAEVGKRVAEHFVISPHADPKHIVYQEVCTWYGALTFAQLSGDKGLSAKLIQRFDL